jgi:hypothetical protein
MTTTVDQATNFDARKIHDIYDFSSPADTSLIAMLPCAWLSMAHHDHARSRTACAPFRFSCTRLRGA